jgi:hypothetical protein
MNVVVSVGVGLAIKRRERTCAVDAKEISRRARQFAVEASDYRHIWTIHDRL